MKIKLTAFAAAALLLLAACAHNPTPFESSTGTATTTEPTPDAESAAPPGPRMKAQRKRLPNHAAKRRPRVVTPLPPAAVEQPTAPRRRHHWPWQSNKVEQVAPPAAEEVAQPSSVAPDVVETAPPEPKPVVVEERAPAPPPKGRWRMRWDGFIEWIKHH